MPTLPKGTASMIYFIYGENNFLSRQHVRQLQADYDYPQAQEVYDGSELASEQLPQILQGVTLFSTHKQVVLKYTADNKTVWSSLAQYIESLDETIELIILEETPDKRTKTFKLLQKIATVKEYIPFSEAQAKTWLSEQAAAKSVSLTARQIGTIIDRVGTDAWQLHYALEKLRTLESVTDDQIEYIIDAQPDVSAFAVIDSILAQKKSALGDQLLIIKDSQDPHQFFGLLSQQLFLLIALSLSKNTTQQIAKDLGVHPYPLQKMAPLAKSVDSDEQQRITTILTRCDDQLKRSGGDPWLIVERAILALADRHI